MWPRVLLVGFDRLAREQRGLVSPPWLGQGLRPCAGELARAPARNAAALGREACETMMLGQGARCAKEKLV